MDRWEEIDTYAKQWIKEAGSRIIGSLSSPLRIETKSNRNDLVTNIDKETEQFLIQKIRTTFPGHRILGEEGFGEDVKDAGGIIWILDPIDGTVNFVHQKVNFMISIGVYENGEGRLGYIYDVVRQELYSAWKGRGAYFNGARLPKLKENRLEDTILALNPFCIVENRIIDPKKLASLVRNVRGTRCYGSAALELAYVAAGRLDAYVTMRLSPWDFAAGKVIVEEVGGIVTDIYGRPLNILENSSVFVSKPKLHETILERYLKE
ncbi:inositol-1-monophosphatase [Weizmannia acidilactici]|uniref:inositol-phosphate phosphatase n=1 Tax=Weizmannia acidilactici TaxID=2607726 RepID=A0A5J4J7C7_9BACI|nr:inositol monophosphatase family protein [Weizmannia acidilactici]GER68431.1 inositol-1-monophosphatase [Weizmannia acidilactici]GER70826.1 inositol-1-monophosphatase [Weizmannia acidilactici]GER74915.1 inositol-1-monophosphatase [Weizmannia acidilactici]